MIKKIQEHFSLKISTPFIIGFSTTIWLLAMAREIMGIFGGKEGYLYLFLCLGIISIGIGMFLHDRSNIKSGRGLSILYNIIFASSILGSFFALRYMPRIASTVALAPDPSSIIILVITAFIPAAVSGFFLRNMTGHHFSTAEIDMTKSNLAIIFGGLAASVVYLGLEDAAPVKVMFGLAFILYLFGFIFLSYQNANKKRIALPCLVLTVITLFLFLFQADRLENKTFGWRFQGYKLIGSGNTSAGSVAVVERDAKTAIAINGIVSKEDGYDQSETSVHLPLLFSGDPKTIYYIGKIDERLVREYLKYPEIELFISSIDAGLTQGTLEGLSSTTKKILADPRIKFLSSGPDQVLESREKRFDAIMVNIGRPMNNGQNRYLSRDFMARARNNLTDDGMYILALDYDENFRNPEINRFLASVNRALHDVFSEPYNIPTRKLLLIGKTQVRPKKEAMIEKFKKNGLKTSFIVGDYFNYALRDRRAEDTFKILAANPASESRIWEPSSYFFSNMSKLRLSEDSNWRWLDSFYEWRWFWLLLIVSPPFIIFAFKDRIKIDFIENKKNILNYLTGGVSIGSGLLAIIIWQSYLSSVYGYLSVLSAFFMAGMIMAFFISKRIKTIFRYKPQIVSLAAALIMPLSVILALNYLEGLATFWQLAIIYFWSFAAGISLVRLTMKSSSDNIALNNSSKISSFVISGGIAGLIITQFIFPFLGIFLSAAFLTYLVAIGFTIAISE
jgi:predicted membrane-bound spermidine synthase